MWSSEYGGNLLNGVKTVISNRETVYTVHCLSVITVQCTVQSCAIQLKTLAWSAWLYWKNFSSPKNFIWLAASPIITINVPLIMKMREIIFFAGKLLYEPFLGIFWGGQDFFDPLNCPEHSKGQFWGQKSRGPLKIFREMAHKVICPKTKNNLSNFQN